MIQTGDMVRLKSDKECAGVVTATHAAACYIVNDQGFTHVLPLCLVEKCGHCDGVDCFLTMVSQAMEG